MKVVLVKTGLMLLTIFWLAGCVTTTTSSMVKKKDLSKAELTYIQIGYAHISEQNLQAAKSSFDRALTLNKSSAGALMGMGIIFAAEEEPALAEKYFSSAIRSDKTPESRFQYAIWRYNVQDYKKAYSQMGKVVTDTSYFKRAEAYDILGLLALRLDKPANAITYFKKAITLNRQQINSYINLSNAYMTQDEPVKAYEAYNGFAKLVRIDFAIQSSTTLWLGTQLAFLNGDVNAASSYGLQLKELFPESREAQLFLDWQESQ